MERDLIIIREYCRQSNIDMSFISLLEEGGLIEINLIEGEKYIDSSQLGELEMFTRLYYDLSINVEGIDAINHLLDRVIKLRKEVTDLRARLDFYESQSTDFIDI